ncbi:MAG: hypothetical protein M1813_007921 [Trichoglossum hirsutum]|nr:MAG: hypothetical protein M1813_007921 [Trichoglossum hirsutum]
MTDNIILQLREEKVEEDLQEHFNESLTPTERLIQAIDNYIKKEELWKSQYVSLEALEKELDRDFSIKRTLKSYIHMTSQQQSEICSITQHWEHALLTALNRLSKIESRERTLLLLQQAIQDRKARPKTRKNDHLVVGDVNSVICQLESSRRERVEFEMQAMELLVLHQDQVDTLRHQLELSREEKEKEKKKEKEEDVLQPTNNHLYKAADIGLEKVYYHHCRILAGAVELKTSKSKAELNYRLSLIDKEGDSVGVCRDHSEWFTMKFQEQEGRTKEGIYRFVLEQPALFSFDASGVFERFVDSGT